MSSPSEPHETWPDGDIVQMGDYTFRWPFIPKKDELRIAEAFVTDHPDFLLLPPKDVHRDVVKLVIAITAENSIVGDDEGARFEHDVDLLGGMVVHIIATRQGGDITRELELLGTDGVE